MDGLLKLVGIVLILYLFGRLSRRNEERVERAVDRFLRLFRIREREVRSPVETPPSSPQIVDAERFRRRFNISPREWEVVALAVGGKTNREIEQALFISLATVKDHLRNVFRKTGVRNRVELANLVRSRIQEP